MYILHLDNLISTIPYTDNIYVPLVLSEGGFWNTFFLFVLSRKDDYIKKQSVDKINDKAPTMRSLVFV